MASFPALFPLLLGFDESEVSDKVAAYARQVKQLLPAGRLWRSDLESVLHRLAMAIAEELARVDDRAEALVEESDPSAAVECLPEWEAMLGLPDGCRALGDTVSARQGEASWKYTLQGGQTAAYFIALAAHLGYTATVTETGPYTWRMDVALAVPSTPFRAGASRSGDRISASGVADLECTILRAKPAHTSVSFAYA